MLPRAVLRTLFGNAAFGQFAPGAALVVLVGYGVAAFLPPFFIRGHHLGLAEVGLLAGLINGGAAALGTLLGGLLPMASVSAMFASTGGCPPAQC